MLAEFRRRRMQTQQDGPVGRDVATGDYGPLARLHTPFALGGSTTSLIVFNEGRINGRDQGLNYPMTAANTAAIARAVAAADRCSAALTKNEFILMWPERGTEHPIIPLITSLAAYHKLNQKAHVDELWATLEGLESLDAKVHLAAVVNKMSRISVRDHRVITAAELRDNLLAFRDCFSMIDRPPTFRWLLPYSTTRGEPSISGVCLLDTVWAVLMRQAYPPQLLVTVYAQLRRRHWEVDWDSNDVQLALALRWIDILLHRKDSDPQMLTNDLTDIERQRIDDALDESVRREYEQRIRIANSFVRIDWRDNPSYRWGRFVAVCCALKGYYHWIYHKKVLPKPRTAMLKPALAQPATFFGQAKTHLYLEQVQRRVSTLNPLMTTYACLLSELSEPPPDTLSQKQQSVAQFGFLHQLDGLERARRHKSANPELDLVLDSDD